MSNYFVWDLNPEIVHIIGPFGLRWYSLLFLAGILVGNAIFVNFMSKEGKDTSLKDSLLYYVVIGTIVGARLGHVLFYDPVYHFSQPWRILQTWEGGLASHGGFTGVIIALYLFSRKHRDFSFFWLADRMAVVSIMAGGFIRLANFCNSEVVGHPTTVPWAVIFKRLDMIPRHPTQLYESLGYFVISFILYSFYRAKSRNPREGSILGLAFILGYGFRFFIEFLKENQSAFEDGMFLNMGQLLSIPFVLLGCWLLTQYPQRQLWLAWAFSKSALAQAVPKSSSAADRKLLRKKLS